MKELLNKVTKLIEVKKIIALMVVTVFCYLSAKGTIGAEQFTTVVTLVLGYYYGQSSTRQAIKETK